MSKKIAAVSEECVACGTCMTVCPRGAIAVFRGQFAVVDQGKCVGCGKCAASCPACVIVIVPVKGE